MHCSHCHGILTAPLGQEEHDATKRRTHPWTLTHSWYAYMGGFVFDTGIKTSMDDREYISGSPRFCLLPPGVGEVAERGLLPDYPRQYIRDKSKADNFAKFFVVLQSSWMIVQCGARWSSGLVVTTLELNTLAHAVCALGIFLIWWDKPLDISEPTVFTGDRVRNIASVVWASTDAGRNPFLPTRDEMISDPPQYNEWLGKLHFAREVQHLSWVGLDTLPTHVRSDTDALAETFPDSIGVYNMSKHAFIIHAVGQTADSMLRVGADELKGTNILIDVPTLIRWQLIWDLLQSPEEHASRWPWLIPKGEPSVCIHPHNRIAFESRDFKPKNPMARKGLIGNRVPNFELVEPRHKGSALSVRILLYCAIVYGGLHASAWNDKFPSPAEHMLWRISCVYITGFSLLAWLVAMALRISYCHRHCPRDLMDTGQSGDRRLGVPCSAEEKLAPRSLPPLCRRCLIFLLYKVPHRLAAGARLFLIFSAHGSRLAYWPGMVLSLVLLLVYVVGRVYLVVEAFVGLRSLPPSAFQVVQWTQFLAHI